MTPVRGHEKATVRLHLCPGELGEERRGRDHPLALSSVDDERSPVRPPAAPRALRDTSPSRSHAQTTAPGTMRPRE
ncbi:hypothetical protein AAFF_G00056750 [Aldrovandia affinis]|uniref:Uncharacterized protein n=1 Tax=Aldrovandia affinis TaxID=143900 RepID=A0AAD7S0K2_9TELE|nr:hypothetical protein AAFF_G00056750 [Aldrovandia affinis]